MAVYFATSNPQDLLNAFNAKINQSEQKGNIETWEMSADKNYYTHKAQQWAKQAWFKPVVESGKLTFNIVAPEGKNISIVAYGYYHGHLIETFLNHFEKLFTTAKATAGVAAGDVVKG